MAKIIHTHAFMTGYGTYEMECERGRNNLYWPIQGMKD
jgi:hypothetical protein